VRIVKDLDVDLGGRDVIVVEDIVDSGLTLNYLLSISPPATRHRRRVRAFRLKEGQQTVGPDRACVGFLASPTPSSSACREARCGRALPDSAEHPHFRRASMVVCPSPSDDNEQYVPEPG